MSHLRSSPACAMDQLCSTIRKTLVRTLRSAHNYLISITISDRFKAEGKVPRCQHFLLTRCKVKTMLNALLKDRICGIMILNTTGILSLLSYKDNYRRSPSMTKSGVKPQARQSYPPTLRDRNSARHGQQGHLTTDPPLATFGRRIKAHRPCQGVAGQLIGPP